MKSAIQQLSEAERETLALLYDKPDWKVVRKLIDIERSMLAEDHVGLTDINRICNLSGQSDSLKRLVGTVKENFNSLNKQN